MLVTRVARRLRHEVHSRFGPKPEWLKKKAVTDRDFDRRHGVDTGGETHLRGIVQSDNWREGSSHIAVDPEEFAAAVAALDVDPSRFTFVDLGSGKGRALMLAADHGFKEVIGVEFAEPLVEIARANLRGSKAVVIHGDATTYDLPPVPTVLFLYNPFGRRLMDAVARRTRESLKQYPRDLIVVYLNPFHGDAWAEAGFKQLRRGPHFAIYGCSPAM